MFWLKSCPRCSGDLYQDDDQYGCYVSCLQCGLSRDVSGQLTVLSEISAEPALPPAVPQWEANKRRRMSHGGRHFARTFDFSSEPAAQSAA